MQVARSELEHFKKLYDLLKDDAPRMYKPENDIEPTCAAIAKWFSDKDPPISECQILQDSLVFMLRYYYMRQFRIHKPSK